MLSNEVFKQTQEAFTGKEVVMGFNRYVITGTVLSVDRNGYNLVNATVKDNESPKNAPVFETPIIRVQPHAVFIAVL